MLMMTIHTILMQYILKTISSDFNSFQGICYYIVIITIWVTSNSPSNDFNWFYDSIKQLFQGQ